MARVFLTSATVPDNEHGRLELKYLQGSAQQDDFDVHELTEDPAAADLILFVERENAAGMHLEKVRQHLLMQKYREKCFVFNPRYKDVPLVPGVYASIPKTWYNPRRTRAGHYPEVAESERFNYEPDYGEEPYLYSFVGKMTNPVRSRLAKLVHPRGFFRDTSDNEVKLRKVNEWGKREEEYIQRYVDITKQSKFVLCPRGTGPSTMRLYEVLLLGRTPVIISDEWVPPVGPRWEQFSLRVAEKNAERVPDLLEQHEDQAEAMGRRARQAWEQWFSPEASFHRIVEWCLEIRRERLLPESIGGRLAQLQLLRPSRLYGKYRATMLKPLRKLKP